MNPGAGAGLAVTVAYSGRKRTPVPSTSESELERRDGAWRRGYAFYYPTASSGESHWPTANSRSGDETDQSSSSWWGGRSAPCERGISPATRASACCHGHAANASHDGSRVERVVQRPTAGARRRRRVGRGPESCCDTCRIRQSAHDWRKGGGLGGLAGDLAGACRCGEAALEAALARDVEAIMKVGDQIIDACERCHEKHWIR